MESIHDKSEFRKESTPEPLHINGRPIGVKNERRATFFVGPKNWYRAGNGYSLDAYLVQELEGSVDVIEFFDKRARRRETIPYERFACHAWATKDYGHGVKLVCDARFYDSRFNPPPPEPPAAPCLFPLPTPQGPVLSAAGGFH